MKLSNLSIDTKRKIAFALLMALVTGAITAFVGVTRNYGLHAGFFMLWRRSFEVGYPTIVFCILVIAPQIQKFTNSIVKD